MLRNRSVQNMPAWAQLFVNELLKPPKFLVPDSQQEATKPHEEAASMPAAHESRSEHTKNRSSSARKPESASAGSNSYRGVTAVQIDPGRRWHAALVRSDIPEQVLYSYGWDILDVTRHENIVHITTDDGDFALKRTHIPPQRIKFLAKAVDHAKRAGFTRCAEIVRNANGRFYATIDNQTYYATRWLQGMETNFASTTQVGEVAQSLAQWHEATRGYHPEGYLPDSEFGLQHMMQERYEDLRALLAQAESKATLDAFDTTFLSIGSGLRKDAQKSAQLMEASVISTFLKSDMKNPGLCHLDVIPGNFIYDKNHKIHLLDLDLSTYAPRALDIAHLLRRGLERTNWNTEVAYAVFMNFNEVGEIRPAEYLMVQALLTFPYRAWRLAHTRYRVLKDDMQTEEIKTAASEEVRRRAFLESYARQIPESES